MIIALIPARYQSTRLPGKPLFKFGNLTMIQKVYVQVLKCSLIDKVYVITDDERIQNNIKDIGGNTIVVQEKCLNGTERICLAIKQNPKIFSRSKIIINVQGDEPYIEPDNISKIIRTYQNKNNKNIVCSTLHYQITNRDELSNPNIGKLVLDKNNCIMYCSRNCIPSNKELKPDLEKQVYYGHIGVFLFEKEYLLSHYLEENTNCQKEEDIEWLKIIEQGYKIVSSEVKNYEIGVNTQQDYDYLLKKYF